MLSDEIKKFFRGEVWNDEATREKYSRDYSIFKVQPELVVAPKDVEDVKNLVRFAVKKRKGGEKTSLTARSAGTDMSGGPLNESVIVDFTAHFNCIGEIGSDYAVVESGVYFRDFEKELDERELLYPAYPASKDICAIGGMIANNSGGEKTLAYGKTENYVEELKVVLADGEEHALKPLSGAALKAKLKEKGFEGELHRKLYKLIEENYDEVQKARPNVSKNSSGYALWNVWDKKTFDVTKLIVGSQGTLGLVTEAKLRLVPKKKFSRLAVIFLKDIAPVADLVNSLLAFKPESLESYDDKTLGVALRYLPGIVRLMKGNILTLAWQFLPEVWMALAHGVPKMILLALLTSDDERELESRAEALARVVKEKFRLPVRIVRSKEEAEKYWVIRRQSFALLHGHIKDKDTAPFIDDIIVRPEYLPEFLAKLNGILGPYEGKLVYTIAGHPGDGNFHIIPLMDLKNPAVRALIPEISKKVYRLVISYKGSITAEHNDGLIRTPYLEAMYGKKMVKLFAEVKKIFDPLGIFNPGKKVGGSLEYAFQHIRSAR